MTTEESQSTCEGEGHKTIWWINFSFSFLFLNNIFKADVECNSHQTLMFSELNKWQIIKRLVRKNKIVPTDKIIHHLAFPWISVCSLFYQLIVCVTQVSRAEGGFFFYFFI